MGILSGMFEERTAAFNLSQDPPDWYMKMQGWGNGDLVVNKQTAMQVSAVFACIRVLSDTIGSLPLLLYSRRGDGGKDRAVNHPLYPILHDLPNPEMTSIELRETLMGHLGGWGNAYAEIDWNANTGRINAIWPLRPDKMRIERIDGELVYWYLLPDKVGGAAVPFRKRQIMHVRGLGFNGLVGYSPIGMAKRAIWLSMAAEEYGTKFFQNDARPSAVLQHPGELGEKAAKNLRESWEELHSGLSNKHRVAILEEGMELKNFGIPPEEAQFLETRKFQVNEIARMYRIPPHMIGDLERATFSNIEHQSIEFVSHVARPWCVRFEQAVYRDCLTTTERQKYFAEFLVDGLLRGDIQSRYTAYATGRQNGWLSANDIRKLENQNPVEGGDVYLVPLNMVPADTVGEFRSSPKPEMIERRSMRSAMARRRLSIAHTAVFEDTAARILRREINDVRNNAVKAFKKRGMDSFRIWLDEFYEDHREFIKRHMMPLFTTFGDVVGAEAAGEIGVDWDGLPPEIEKFIREYVDRYAARHVGSSIGQIKSVAGDAEQSGADPIEALDKRFGEWEERRPAKIAMRETIQSNSAIAVAVYAINGILRLRWRAFGESCPYCSKLNGKVVGIQQNFLSAGEDYQPDGADRPLTPSVDVKHAPAHDGCDCTVTAAP